MGCPPLGGFSTASLPSPAGLLETARSRLVLKTEQTRFRHHGYFGNTYNGCADQQDKGLFSIMMAALAEPRPHG
jgi:hypothetical protein